MLILQVNVIPSRGGPSGRGLKTPDDQGRPFGKNPTMTPLEEALRRILRKDPGMR